MLQYELSAKERTTFGKGANRALRREGLSPAVLYGPKSSPKALQLETKEVTRVLIKWQKRNAVFNIDVDGAKHHVMVKEVQAKPVDNSLLHVDFYEIALDAPMEIDVPVVFAGKAKGVDLGGELHVTKDKISVKATPLNVPDFIEIDVSGLDIGDNLNFGDLQTPDNVEMLNAKDEQLVSVITASKERPEEDVEVEAVDEAVEATEDTSAE